VSGLCEYGLEGLAYCVICAISTVWPSLKRLMFASHIRTVEASLGSFCAWGQKGGLSYPVCVIRFELYPDLGIKHKVNLFVIPASKGTMPQG
jgi:hypothetical protein